MRRSARSEKISGEIYLMEAVLAYFNGPVIYLALLVFLVLCGLGNPVPEDLALITSGYMIHTGTINLLPALVVCYLGVLAGDTILYGFGCYYGQKVIAHPRFLRMIPLRRVELIRKKFHRWGHWTVLLARFLVGFRAPTFLLSGVMHIRFSKFILLDGIGALVSVPLFIGLGIMFGSNMDMLRHNLGQIQHWLIVLGVGVIGSGLLVLWWRSRGERSGV